MALFPALPLPKLHLPGNALSCSLGLVPLQDASVEAALKEQFSNVFIGESEEVRKYPACKQEGIHWEKFENQCFRKLKCPGG